MKLIHTADLHLKENSAVRWEALRELADLACREKIEVLIISGDLFDRQADAERLRPEIRQILSQGSFTTVIIPGNHDAGVFRSGLYFGDRVKVITDPEVPVDIGGALIFGLPYDTRSGEQVAYQLQSLAGRLSKEVPNVLLYHGELLDSYFSSWEWGNEGEQRYMPVRLSFFQGLPVDYVLAGHFHSRYAVWRLPEGGYFVYPGSPVAITSREKGRRKVNLFNLGEAPGESMLSTFHLEQVDINLEPEMDSDPGALVCKHLSGVHPSARLLLTVRGFYNSRLLGMNEQQLVNKIRQAAGDRLYQEPEFLFRDISTILENSLYRSFVKRLEKAGYPPEQQQSIQEMVIRAMVGSGA